jgi:predicted transcriptional regulator
MSNGLDEQVRAIMSTLSNRDALCLFNLAEEGIESSERVFKTYGLTKKRYYQRLRELVKLDLIRKEESTYKHTMLGSIIFENQVKGLRQTILNRGNIAILQELRNRLTDADSQASLNKISEEVLKEMEQSLGVSGLKPIRLYRNWDELVQALQNLIGSMDAELLVASRYVDFRPADLALQAASRGCKIRVIHSNRGTLSERLQIFGNIIANPHSITTYSNFVKNPNVSMRKSYVPYSFVVADSRSVGIEIVSPSDPASFFLGLEFESITLARKMKLYFEALWTSGETDDMSVMFARPMEEILREVEHSGQSKNHSVATNH